MHFRFFPLGGEIYPGLAIISLQSSSGTMQPLHVLWDIHAPGLGYQAYSVPTTTVGNSFIEYDRHFSCPLYFFPSGKGSIRHFPQRFPIASNYRTLTSAFFLNESNSLTRDLVAASRFSPPCAWIPATTRGLSASLRLLLNMAHSEEKWDSPLRVRIAQGILDMMDKNL